MEDLKVFLIVCFKLILMIDDCSISRKIATMWLLINITDD